MCQCQVIYFLLTFSEGTYSKLPFPCYRHIFMSAGNIVSRYSILRKGSSLIGHFVFMFEQSLYYLTRYKKN